MHLRSFHAQTANRIPSRPGYSEGSCWPSWCLGKGYKRTKKKLLEAFKTITGKIFNLTQQMFVDYETRGKCDDIVSGSGAGVVIDSAAMINRTERGPTHRNLALIDWRLWPN